LWRAAATTANPLATVQRGTGLPARRKARRVWTTATASDALGRAATYIKTQLEEYGLTVEEQVFIAQTPLGPKQFRNIVAKTRVQLAGPDRVIIIGSHYDTKFFTNITFVGANDGGSSSGALLEIARIAAEQPSLWFVFFDVRRPYSSTAKATGFGAASSSLKISRARIRSIRSKRWSCST